MYLSEDFSDSYKRHKDWLQDQSNTGNNVTDIALDELNQARQDIWHMKLWDGLIKEADFSLTDNAASLPSDWGKTFCIGYDSDGDGKLDYFFFANTVMAHRGYKIRNTYTRAGGHSRVITFYNTPSQTPTIYYQVLLNDFTNLGTEKLFFPAKLLENQAKLIHLEGAPIPDEYDVVQQAFDKRFRTYVRNHQYQNRDLRNVVLDNNGIPIQMESEPLDGSVGRDNLGHDDDYDLG